MKSRLLWGYKNAPLLGIRLAILRYCNYQFASNKLEPLKGVWSLYSQSQAFSKSKVCWYFNFS
ncbi:hypothetical protein B0X66_01730 [Helicobacter pylori]|nr:hypothetical protein B0X66_01730 [Helicobacter pylori]